MDVAARQNGLCIEGSASDVLNCGFTTQEAAATGCLNFANDECCAPLLQRLRSGQPAAGGDAKNEQEGDPRTSGFSLSAGSIIAIAVAGAFFLIILVVILFVKRRGPSKKAATPENPYLKYDSTSQEKLNPGLESSGGNYRGMDESRGPTANYMGNDKQDLYTNNMSSLGALSPQAAPSSSIQAPRDSRLMIAVHPYYPTLADELRLEIGDDVLLLKAFDGSCQTIY